jgi:hypothetical protein
MTGVPSGFVGRIGRRRNPPHLVWRQALTPRALIGRPSTMILTADYAFG